MNITNDGIYIYDLEESEKQGFNVLFPELFDVKSIDMDTVRKQLSGIRLNPPCADKATRLVIQKWLWHWQMLGFVSILHGQVRLGSPGLYFDLLDEDNKKLIKNLDC